MSTPGDAAGDRWPAGKPGPYADLWSTFDTLGTEYERHAADGIFNAHYDRPAVLRMLGEVAGRRVLDAGCGPGFYVEELLRRGADVSAFDASPVMVALCRARVAGRAKVDRAVLGTRLPYPDAGFDLVVCALTVQYVDDRPAAFAELHRVLKPGGALVLSTQHPLRDWQRKGGSYFESRLEEDPWQMPSGVRHVPFWRTSLSGLCDAMTDTGMVIEKVMEPRPAESMRELDAERYDKLDRVPAHLVLRLRNLTGLIEPA